MDGLALAAGLSGHWCDVSVGCKVSKLNVSTFIVHFNLQCYKALFLAIQSFIKSVLAELKLL